MTRPRIFISSTYFDLKSIREELDRFVSTMGYEAVRHEQGQIAYGKDEAPETYAYREVEYIDILVSIIGSKYGTQSVRGEYSISQTELKQAIEQGKQVYIFIDEAVHSEYRFFQANKGIGGVKYSAVTDTRIYQFIEEVYALPHGNPIFSFQTGADLIQLLRDQWAGLFQRLLNHDAGKGQAAAFERLQQSLQTVDELVKFLQTSHQQNKSELQGIILANHPLFARLREGLKVRYRIYFANLGELQEWLTNARNLEVVTPLPDDTHLIWMRKLQLSPVARNRPVKVQYQTVKVARSLFDTHLNP